MAMPRQLLKDSDPVGKLRHLITIQENQAVTQNAAGELPENWQPVAVDLWARVDELSGTKLYAARQVQPDLVGTVTLRYWPGLDARKHRFVYGTRIFNITDVRNPESKGVWMEVDVREQVGRTA